MWRLPAPRGVPAHNIFSAAEGACPRPVMSGICRNVWRGGAEPCGRVNIFFFLFPIKQRIFLITYIGIQYLSILIITIYPSNTCGDSCQQGLHIEWSHAEQEVGSPGAGLSSWRKNETCEVYPDHANPARDPCPGCCALVKGRGRHRVG